MRGFSYLKKSQRSHYSEMSLYLCFLAFVERSIQKIYDLTSNQHQRIITGKGAKYP